MLVERSVDLHDQRPHPETCSYAAPPLAFACVLSLLNYTTIAGFRFITVRSATRLRRFAVSPKQYLRSYIGTVLFAFGFALLPLSFLHPLYALGPRCVPSTARLLAGLRHGRAGFHFVPVVCLHGHLHACCESFFCAPHTA